MRLFLQTLASGPQCLQDGGPLNWFLYALGYAGQEAGAQSGCGESRSYHHSNNVQEKGNGGFDFSGRNIFMGSERFHGLF